MLDDQLRRRELVLSYQIRPSDVGGSRLVSDYLLGSGTVADFFAGDPFHLASYRAKLDEVARRFGPAERANAARALLPTSANARDRLRRFVTEGGAMVTTGQQAGFLTGPLYTIHKALSTVVLARHLEEQLGVIVLPVFWAATEDHDWAEANHAFLLDHRSRLERFALPEATEARALPMAEFPLGEGIDKVLDEALQYLGKSGVEEGHLRSIIDPYRVPDATVGSAFVGAMAGILAPWDVLVADAAAPPLKAASAATMRLALTDAEGHEGTLRRREKALVDAGYGAQVAVLERGVNLFLHGDGGRERLYRRGRDFVVREGPGVLERESLLDLLAAAPERFSPNVLLRPVVESAVFPTLAYVGGPGEINYFAQVTALFQAIGIEPALIVPRFSAVVVDEGVDRMLEKIGLEETMLKEPRETLRSRLARQEVPDGVTSALTEIRASWAAGFEQLIDQAEAVDPSLAGSLGALRNRGLLAGLRAEREIVRAIKQRDLVPFARLDRVLNELRPTGHPQDRVLNLTSFLARYGDGFLASIAEAIRRDWRLPSE